MLNRSTVRKHEFIININKDSKLSFFRLNVLLPDKHKSCN